MNDYFGRVPKPGDTVVYPVMKEAQLILRHGMVTTVLQRSVSIIAERPDKAPIPVSLTVDSRFVIMPNIL